MSVQKRKTVDEIFGVKNGVGSTSNSTFTMPNFASRDFPGATTKKKKKNNPPFGPAMEFKSEFSDMGSSLGDAGGVMGGDAGGGMGESISADKFTAFMESITTDDNSENISVIMKGFNTMLESDYADSWPSEVSAKDARRQVERHGNEYSEFTSEVGAKKTYTKKEVLDWLGY